jgi:hypothetical protein
MRCPWTREEDQPCSTRREPFPFASLPFSSSCGTMTRSPSYRRLLCRQALPAHRTMPLRSHRHRDGRCCGATDQRLADVAGLFTGRLRRQCGVHRTFMGTVERGESNLSFQNIARVAATLGLSLPDCSPILRPVLRAWRLARLQSQRVKRKKANKHRFGPASSPHCSGQRADSILRTRSRRTVPAGPPLVDVAPIRARALNLIWCASSSVLKVALM